MKFKPIFFGITFLAVPVLADTQTEILTDKLNRLESEMALMQKKVYQIPENQETGNQHPKNIDEFYSSLDMQNKTIQELTQKNEELSHELTELKEKFNRLNEDVNFRFNELKNTPPAPVLLTSSEKSEATTETEDYNKAYQFLKNGNNEKAEQAFLNFMEKYPNGKLIGNANYWLAESYYARRKLNEAAGLFADGFTKYKDNSKASDSMFKLGLTMKELGKKKEACTALKGLIKNYKNLNKNLKDRTQKEIKELKCP